MKILNFGSINIDHVYHVASFVQPGETISSRSYEKIPGGKGFNQSIALARAGAKVYHAGKVGADGGDLLALLAQSGVNTDLIERSSLPTGHAIIQVNEQGQNCILLSAGANHDLQKQEIISVFSHFSADDVLVLQNEVNHLDFIIEEAAKIGMTIVLNPSPFDDRVKVCDLTKVQWFFVNEGEGQELTGQTDGEHILDSFSAQYPQANVVLTLGAQGAWCLYQGERFFHPALTVSAVDTTAAGDTFTGYFLASLLAEKDINAALSLATKAAALAVSKSGASSSIPLRQEVEAARF